MSGRMFYTDVHYFDSNALETVYWDDVSRNLYVEFLNGSVVGYSNVPSFTFEKFTEAASAGKFYNTSIKNSFVGHAVSYTVTDLTERLIEPTVRSEYVPDPVYGKYRISFTLDSETDFNFAAGDIVGALNEFKDKFGKSDNPNTDLRVRSIAEVV